MVRRDERVRRLLGALLPGALQALDRRPLLAGILLASAGGGIGMVVASLLSGRELLLDESRLRLLIGGLTLLSASLLLSVMTSRTPRPASARGRARYGGVALLSVMAAMLPAVTAAWLVVPQLGLVERTFVDVPRVLPHQLATVPEAATTDPGRVPDRLTGDEITEAPTLETPVPTLSIIPGRTNILLLGGDAGPGRSGLRTDSINLVSIEPVTGDIAIIGIPRNLQGAPLPPGLRGQFPQGFDNLINAVYGWGRNNRQAVLDAVGPTEDSGATLITSVVSELTGQPVDAFVLVDMQGFLELVDAIGGVDMHVDKPLPAPGNVPGAKHPVTDLQPGWYRFDGTDALSYARSRKADSDYSRMSRQRCLLASIAAQTSTVDLITRWPALSRVISDMVRTNLTPDMFDLLVAFAGADTSQARSLALTPPGIPTKGWSLDTIRQSVAAFLRTNSALDPNTVTAPTTTAPTTTTTIPSTTAPSSTTISGTDTIPAGAASTSTTPEPVPTTAVPAVTEPPPEGQPVPAPPPVAGTLLGSRCQVRKPA